MLISKHHLDPFSDVGGDQASGCLSKIEDRLEQQPEPTASTRRLYRCHLRRSSDIGHSGTTIEDNSLRSVLSLGECLGLGEHRDIQISALPSVIL